LKDGLLALAIKNAFSTFQSLLFPKVDLSRMKHVFFRKLSDRAYLLDGLDGYFRLPLSLSRDDPKRRRFRDMIFSWFE